MNSRDHLDHFALKAQREGYPARSVYKLKEIDERFLLIRPGKRVLDVGCSPGSWGLYVLRSYPMTPVVGVDIQDLGLDPPQHLSFYRLDIMSPEALAVLGPMAPFGTLMSDAAPNTSGHASVDVARSEALVEQVLFLARSLLEVGGNWVAKLFQGSGMQAIVKEARAVFETVRTFRPKAVRPESRETYLIGLSRKEML